ncbi:hypothetical protein [Anaeromyxobacter paludicola]|uniref:Uncharacterized protein n=1 Tax=Anaeromyxobacter paludicola TaxID=2918171 RepID=A0ABM7X9S1_9BACT|nr:hypothetical protein [Anaeromyxobacter paludicola]BDG08582.1 hypothetical protein AMPC_16950 [Anaeromyxobacter paludicola]
MEQVLRDRTGRMLGKVKQVGNGKFEGRDASGRLRGTYDPKDDKTRDHTGRIVGSGNQLPTLIVS